MFLCGVRQSEQGGKIFWSQHTCVSQGKVRELDDLETKLEGGRKTQHVTRTCHTEISMQIDTEKCCFGRIFAKSFSKNHLKSLHKRVTQKNQKT